MFASHCGCLAGTADQDCWRIQWQGSWETLAQWYTMVDQIYKIYMQFNLVKVPIDPIGSKVLGLCRP